VLPPLDPDSGLLAAGVHEATWEEIVERFGWTERRRRQLDGLAEIIDMLSEAGCHRVWLNGSFVTAKDEPGDFDACWDPDGVDVDLLDPILVDLSAEGRRRQKERFGGELFPNVVEAGSGLELADFFQNERDGSRKGIVLLRIGGGS